MESPRTSHVRSNRFRVRICQEIRSNSEEVDDVQKMRTCRRLVCISVACKHRGRCEDQA